MRRKGYFPERIDAMVYLNWKTNGLCVQRGKWLKPEASSEVQVFKCGMVVSH